MDCKEKNNLIVIKLDTNEDLLGELEKTCKIYNIMTAIVISGIGQLKQAKLGYFREKNDYSPTSFLEPLELLSLNGNICKQNGKYIFHLHTILGNEMKNTYGGHLIDATVSVTAEIVLLKTDLIIKRQYDQRTGLQSLRLE